MKHKKNVDVDLEEKSGIERFFRRLVWIFSKSGVIPLAFEHFLAMIPATILVPVLVNNSFSTLVIDMSLVLFTSGLGTILFIILTKGRIPAYLGSSFAYIGLTIYLVEQNLTGTTHAMAYSYVGWAYIFSGVCLALLSLMYLIKDIDRKLVKWLPPTVVGPAISLIGLELADTAVVDSGFDVAEGLVDKNAAIVAISTLVVIILFSLFRHRLFKNAAIIIGMLVGCVIAFALDGFPTENFATVQWFTVPNFNLPLLDLPPNLPSLFLAVLPATFIVFTENTGRITIISRMTNTDEEEIPVTEANQHPDMDVIDEDRGENDMYTRHTVRQMRSSLFSHGIATLAAGLLGSVPNTLYAENIAVMSIHKSDVKHEDPDPFIKKLVAPCSVAPYIIAAFIAILFSFVGVLQTLLLSIPKPVIGGMELFLFGIISAPGIQLLVEQRVNYKKISNQIITAAVLISGISGLSIKLGMVELKGMGLGFVVGFILNALVLLLKWIGNISDEITLDELLIETLHKLPENTKLRVLGYRKERTATVDYNKNYNLKGVTESLKGKNYRLRARNNQWFSDDTIRDEICRSDLVEVGLSSSEGNETFFKYRKTANGLFLDVRSDLLDEKVKNAYLNDYDAIDEDGNWLLVNVSENVPIRRIRALIHLFDAKYSEYPPSTQKAKGKKSKGKK